ncbi:hypothetical protein DPMN_024442 [Dreissena polymorpha]|uniref:Uncharacterized protein n=1 Tax=Dreissena polymorpha TaxID=45954 RepID=A0A9D4RCB5_DREPO|nr:hypothetical protein DPMN_024442 [Dreissena polymorpha]
MCCVLCFRRQGSLVVDHLVIYYTEDFVKGALLEAVALFDRAEMSILGNVVKPSAVNVGKEKGTCIVIVDKMWFLFLLNEL